MTEDTELPDISEHTTVNELADIVRKLDQSLTLRIYDEANEVFGAIRLVTAQELDEIDHMRNVKPASAHIH
tara:strand:- start:8897 stop:9109 length:213 start_codon:yes stop_codon:yes gene_type:complete